MIRKGIRPRIRPVIDWPFTGTAWRAVYPFRRHWPAIAIVLVLDAVFLVPAVGALREAVGGWAGFESLFDLVFAIFISAWLLGWSIAPLLLTMILVALLFGREVIVADRGRLRLFIGLPLIGIAADYDPSRMRNVRFERPPPKSGKSWRGAHLAFDYGANTGAFGSHLDPVAASGLRNRVEMVTGVSFGRGEAEPVDLAGQWEPNPILSAAADAGEAVDPLTEPAAPAEPQRESRLASLSSLALIAANLVPVAGTVFLGWRLSDVMVLYWAESAVIGIFNVIKIAMIGRWAALLAGPFFVGHFGGFMAVHFLFIYTLFVEGPRSDSAGDLTEVGRLFADLWPALVALAVSHGYSFFANFVARGEYRNRSIKDQMSDPYTRIVFMHLVLIFGGFVVLLLGESTPVLLVVIALKVAFDLRAHWREHGKQKKVTDAARDESDP
ncbi:DUF6498-containing protein [Elongatibacter sediminis]|uniref:DUF6498-containing protein n=1 Tax=Elongatibacter sediminis TaxID=3119006 RepID=A0AAW9RD92_9GAMM